MPNLSKLTLTSTTPNQPMTAFLRNRVKLSRKCRTVDGDLLPFADFVVGDGFSLLKS